MPVRRSAWGAALALVLALGGCTSDASTQRQTTATVAVSYPFGSLNAATAVGRTPGSTLVRGLTHVGFTTLDAAGDVVADTSFGTVEKISDAPLTVRYTIAEGASWSDGTPVTGADLLLEWAARSGQLDETVPTLGADGSLADASSLDDLVSFAATSPALVHAPATPSFDARSLTLVYDQPVADWQVALDVNLPAHVIGRLALDSAPAPAPTASVAAPSLGVVSPTASGAESGAASTPGATPASTDWAAAVADAIVHVDRSALVAISRTWRTAADAGSLATDLAAAVSDGPYVITSVDPDNQVVLTRNRAYTGAAPARFASVMVRSDLAPLDQVSALGSDKVDVVAPVDTSDVRAALAGIGGATVVDGADRVLQLQVGEKSGGAFDPASYPADGAASATAARAAFLGSLDRAALAAAAGAAPSDTVFAQVGVPSATSAPSATAAAASGRATGAVPGASAVPVRLLVDTGDPVRAALVQTITTQAATAGFAVTVVDTTDLATTLWSRPTDWDVALVPVSQGELPVASVLARWRSGGATNVTGHADAALDAVLDRAGTSIDPAAARALLAQGQTALDGAAVVLPLVSQPVLAATDPDGHGPTITGLTAPTWGSADLSAWWAWARD
ncbi:MAG: ABC transporter substrate-binding protein [Cellulomonas sp.]|nr:hypothetical protein [Actinomycetota bacterium]MCG2798713.1 ABC transporter substrate-binding protein [Cellulomonas sp.]